MPLVFNLEGQPMEFIPDGVPLPPGRFPSPQAAATYRAQFAAPPPANPIVQNVNNLYGANAANPMGAAANVQQYFANPGAFATPAAAQAAPVVPQGAVMTAGAPAGNVASPAITGGGVSGTSTANLFGANVVQAPEAPMRITQETDSLWGGADAQNGIQLYDLEGTPQEIIAPGTPIPQGRWDSPTGGFTSQNAGWGLAPGTYGGGNTVTTAIPGDPAHQQMTAINNFVMGGDPNINPITNQTQLNAWLAANPGATFNNGTVQRASQGSNYLNTFGNAIQQIGGFDNRILANEGAQTLAAQLGLAPAQLAAYQQFAPQYAQTDLDVLKQTLFGNIDVNKFFGIDQADPTGTPTKNTEFWEGYINAGGLNGGQQWLNQAALNSSYLDPTQLPSGGGLFGLNQALTKAANQQTISANTALRQGNVDDAANLGGAALTTLQTLNPNWTNSLNQAQTAAGSQGIAPNTYQQQLGNIFGQGPQFSQVQGQTIGANTITAPQMGGVQGVSAGQLGAPQQVSAWQNPLLGTASQQAGSAGMGALGGALQQRAMDQLALGGSLSEEQKREAQQAAREAWGARGLINSVGAVGDEILTRDRYARELQNERQAFAQNVNQLGQGQQGINNQYMLGVLGAGATQGAQGLQAQALNQSAGINVGQTNLDAALRAALANQGASLTTGQANLGSALQAALANQQNAYNAQVGTAGFNQQAQQANQGAGLQAQQQNFGLGTNLAGMDYSRQQQNFGNILANAQLQAQNRFDPFSTITSAGSANQGTNPALFGMGGSASSGALGNQSVMNQFQPFNQYSSDLFNTNYNAMVGSKLNAANNSAATKQATIGAIGQLGGAAIGAKAIFMCVPEGECIDMADGTTRKIEDVRAGDTVVGYRGASVRVMQKHEYAENPSAYRFFRFTLDDGQSLAVCDMHRIQGIRAMDHREGDTFACEKTVTKITRFDGVHRSYDLLTEDGGYRMSGVPVNTMIAELLQKTAELAEVN